MPGKGNQPRCIVKGKKIGGPFATEKGRAPKSTTRKKGGGGGAPILWIKKNRKSGRKGDWVVLIPRRAPSLKKKADGFE